MSDWEDRIPEILKIIEARRPVVQCITNIVTVNDCANALLAIGASPTMAHHPQEMADFARFCDALVCNMGATESLEAMEAAIRMAVEKNHPIVIDPVGCAGSPWRRRKCLDLIDEAGKDALLCIRGNAAEIRALALDCNTGRGVDDRTEKNGKTAAGSIDSREMPAESIDSRKMPAESIDSRKIPVGSIESREMPAESIDSRKTAAGSIDSREIPAEPVPPEEAVSVLSSRTGAIVIASGETDSIGHEGRILQIHGGTPLMARITGSGCMLSSLLGAFLSARFSMESAAACCALMNACGEQAQAWTAEAGRGTGTFRMALLDALTLYGGRSI